MWLDNFGGGAVLSITGVLRTGASAPKYLTDTKSGTLVGSINDTQVWTNSPATGFNRIILPLYISP